MTRINSRGQTRQGKDLFIPKFLAVSILQPDRTAIVDRDRKVTYKQLRRVAAGVGSLLSGNQIGVGDRVAICAEKSIETVAALIGVLEAGAAYVPLDHTAPPARIGRQLQDARVRAIVSTGSMLEQLQPWIPAGCVGLVLGPETCPETPGLCTTHWDDLPAERWLARPVSDQDPAYILYTSGSTGRPKGVVISHAAASAFINWSVEQFELCRTDRVSSHAPLHFDLSVFDVFASLQAGATIVLVPRELSAFPPTLARFIAQHQISVWYSVPSVLVALARQGRLESFDMHHLRTVLFAGEVFPSGDFQKLQAILPEVRYFNLYGPTETNVCTFHEVVDVEAQEPIPIGRPCPFSRVYVTRDRGPALARPGQTGELFVAGASLMTHYWDRPQETQRVLSAGKGPMAGEDLVYRTGDRVRILENGTLVFVDRVDSMIKHRGYRIEPGEIEATLVRQPVVTEAALLVIDGQQQEGRRLIAFVALVGHATERSLRDFCAQSLPAYMLPDRIVTMAMLPRTSTGKVDRVALRDSFSAG